MPLFGQDTYIVQLHHWPESRPQGKGWELLEFTIALLQFISDVHWLIREIQGWKSGEKEKSNRTGMSVNGSSVINADHR